MSAMTHYEITREDYLTFGLATRYSGGPESFWCPLCRFKAGMLRAVESDDVSDRAWLYYAGLTHCFFTIQSVWNFAGVVAVKSSLLMFIVLFHLSFLSMHSRIFPSVSWPTSDVGDGSLQLCGGGWWSSEAAWVWNNFLEEHKVLWLKVFVIVYTIFGGLFSKSGLNMTKLRWPRRKYRRWTTLWISLDQRSDSIPFFKAFWENPRISYSLQMLHESVCILAFMPTYNYITGVPPRVHLLWW